MSNTVSSYKKVKAALIGLGVVCTIIIAAVLISLTTKSDVAWTQNFVDDNIQRAQKVSENSTPHFDDQINTDIQNSFLHLKEHIKESEKRLDEHVQHS